MLIRAFQCSYNYVTSTHFSSFSTSEHSKNRDKHAFFSSLPASEYSKDRETSTHFSLFHQGNILKTEKSIGNSLLSSILSVVQQHAFFLSLPASEYSKDRETSTHFSLFYQANILKTEKSIGNSLLSSILSAVQHHFWC
jgi:phenylalanyl-tRNA synthetase alpha subunit